MAGAAASGGREEPYRDGAGARALEADGKIIAAASAGLKRFPRHKPGSPFDLLGGEIKLASEKGERACKWRPRGAGSGEQTKASAPVHGLDSILFDSIQLD